MSASGSLLHVPINNDLSDAGLRFVGGDGIEYRWYNPVADLSSDRSRVKWERSGVPFTVANNRSGTRIILGKGPESLEVMFWHGYANGDWDALPDAIKDEVLRGCAAARAEAERREDARLAAVKAAQKAKEAAKQALLDSVVTALTAEPTPVEWTFQLGATVLVTVNEDEDVTEVRILPHQSPVTDLVDGPDDARVENARRVINEDTWAPLNNLPDGVVWEG